MKAGTKTGRVSIRRILYAFLILSCLSVALAQASTYPDAKLQGTIGNGDLLWNPGKLAVDGSGTLYVVDSYRNRIQKFDRNGNYTGIIHFASPSTVAVASDGTLYIGSNRNYAVALYRDGSVSGYLGRGEGEFKSIHDISIDNATGDVYVVDNVGGVVKIYNAVGNKVGQISGLNLPTGVVVKGGEIFILDQPLSDVVYSDRTELSTMSRVTVCDQNGAVLSSFNVDSAGDGLASHSDLDTGNDGNIYISDTVMKAVLVYNKAGAYLGAISNPDDAISIATSVALADNGTLYVSSSLKKNVQVFAINGYPSGAGAHEASSVSNGADVIKVSLSGGSEMTNADASSAVSSTAIGDNVVVSVDNGTVVIFDLDGNVKGQITPFHDQNGVLDTALADVDGDGINELVISAMNGSQAAVFETDGAKIADVPGGSGIVSSGDLNGDGKAEVIVLEAGTGAIKGYSLGDGALIDTGIGESVGTAVSIDSGDIDGDGDDEIITMMRGDSVSSMKVYDVLTADGPGKWVVVLSNNLTIDAAGMSIAVKDMNNDKVAEIIMASGSGDILVINGSGVVEGVVHTAGGIADIAIGDMDGDRTSDIIAGLDNGSVTVLTLTGTEIGSFTGTLSRTGVRVSAGATGSE